MTVDQRTRATGDRVTIGAEAIVFAGAGRPLERISVPTVILRPGEVLVAVEVVTLCDLDAGLLADRRRASGPVVPGHEQVGRIVAISSLRRARDLDGRLLAVGDRVIWAAAVGCGRCVHCRENRPGSCRNLRRYGHDHVIRGWELSGGCATHVQLLARTPIVKIEDELPGEVVAGASCRTALARAGAPELSEPEYSGDSLRRGIEYLTAAASADPVVEFALGDAEYAFALLVGGARRVGLRP